MTIQYQEQGIFIDWIEREELQSTLERRLETVSSMLFFSDTPENKTKIFKFLGIYEGKHTFDTAMELLIKRGQSLKYRLDGLNSKPKGN